MFGFGRKNKNGIIAVEAFELINKNISNIDFIILDVRSPEEYYESHIENAENIDYNSQIFESELEKRDKNKKYLIYCRSGHRSSNAIKIMIRSRFYRYI